MKKINLKTFFKPVCKKDETTAHGKELVLKADRNLFAHMLLVAQSRKLKIKDVLSHPLGQLPMALASPNGMMRKTNKSSLGHELQNNVYPAANIPQPCCCIIDGMALVQKMRVCDITKVFDALGYELSQALVSFHAFTECGTASVFDGRGKLSPLKLLKSPRGMSTFNRLGEDRTLLPQVYENIKKCTFLMYNNQPRTYSVNELRYRLFCAKKGKLGSHQIPPYADSLYKHYLSANYQAKIWMSALQNSLDIPGPGDHGWKLDLSDPDGGLVLDWVEGKPAPEIVLELLVCVPVQDYVFACTAFAYGQTGSGKTYTLIGNQQDFTSNLNKSSRKISVKKSPGLVQRTFAYLYRQLTKKQDNQFVVHASYLEIYNETVIDLLNPCKSKHLQIRWSKEKGFYAENVFIVECEGPEDLESVLEEGIRNRIVKCHSMNENSSRSHTILTLNITSEMPDPDDPNVFIRRDGKLSLVDLAGSEKTKKTNSKGETLVEANNINKSLLALGNCISALGDPKKRQGHIPFRDSILTKLLSDSLGGSGVTLMIACVSPSRNNAPETMNTLRYSFRAKRIKSKPVVVMDPRQQHLMSLKREIKLLKMENEYLRDQLEQNSVKPQINGHSENRADDEINPNSKNNLKPDDPVVRKDSVMLPDFMQDNEILRKENAQLIQAKEVLIRDQELVCRENERLLRKLADVERVCSRSPIMSQNDSPLFKSFSGTAPGSRGSNSESLSSSGTFSSSYWNTVLEISGVEDPSISNKNNKSNNKTKEAKNELNKSNGHRSSSPGKPPHHLNRSLKSKKRVTNSLGDINVKADEAEAEAEAEELLTISAKSRGRRNSCGNLPPSSIPVPIDGDGNLKKLPPLPKRKNKAATKKNVEKVSSGRKDYDAGLKDLCIESGVIAAGSVAGVIEGRKYNIAVRFHKFLYEALLRLAWKEFLAVLDQQSDYNKRQIEEMNEKIMELCEHLNQNTFTDILHDRLFETVAQQFGDFLNNLRQGNGTLAAFWMSYIDMVELMLKLLRASREGNWKLHLTSIHEMIPWCFSYDNINYARYLSAYYAEMTNLPEEHPEIHDYLEAGGFSVQIGSKNTFEKIPVDQTVEETVNRDTQTQGGTKGFSLKANALTSRIAKDELDVKNLTDMIESSWINPFSNDYDDLVSISTGRVAPKEVVQDLCSAYKIGQNAYRVFREERLQNTPPLKNFHDPLQKQKLKTFSSTLEKTHCKKQSSTETILKANRNLFARMILIASSRNLDMREILSHPLGPVPWALATADGARGAGSTGAAGAAAPLAFLLRGLRGQLCTFYEKRENSNDCEVLEELQSSQEEADTRIFLHCAHAASAGFETLKIVSDDTDVFVLCLAFCEEIPSRLFQKSGTQARIQYIDINKVANVFGTENCKALLGLHDAITGCDTVSAFAGRGKVNAIKLLKSNTGFRNALKDLGSEWKLKSGLLEKLEEFVCHIYNARASTNSISELRYRLFCAKNGEIESWQLPPCAAALRKHIYRANYQTAIWRRSLEKSPDIPSPVGNGWCMQVEDDGKQHLLIDWLDVAIAPDAVLQLLSCKRSRTCKNPTCPCLENGLRCTDLCRLLICNNQAVVAELSDNDCEDDSDMDDVWN
ncbi:Kinesin-like protein KIF12 [Nymphon striatum]|nr:Kinesin-like protein KIF12 [Nymphon striatum]